MNSLLFLLLACGEKDSDTGAAVDTDTATDTNTDTEDPIDPCAPVEGVEGIRMDGSVIFEDGTGGKGQARVQMCNASNCFNASWGDDGNFCFTPGILSPGYTYSFDVVPLIGEDNSYATPMAFIPITEETQSIELEQAVLVPSFTHSANISDEIFDAGDGLRLSMTGVESDDINQVFSAPVNPMESGLPLAEFEGQNILGLWYFGPFEERTTSPWTLELNNERSNALPEGTELSLYNGSYDDHSWINIGTATIDSDGIAQTEINGIEILSSLLIVY